MTHANPALVPCPDTSAIVELGHVSGVFGTHGWLKVHSYTRPRANLFEYRQWLIGSSSHWQPFTLEESKVHGPSLLVSLVGITARDAAVSLLRQTIAVVREALPKPGRNHYYWTDLIGSTVVNREQQQFGVVRSLLEAGDHDVLVVRGAREYLIPFVPDIYVLGVDLQQRQITVDWHLDD